MFAEQEHRSEPEEEPIVISEEMLAEPVRKQPVRIDFERGLPYLPAMTLGLISLNVVFFLPLGLIRDPQDFLVAIRRTALIRERVLAGEVWRFFTAMFVHGSFGHLLGNALALYIAGMACEHAFGAPRTALIFMLSGLVGGVASVLTHPGPSVGASGAVFGVLGATIAFFYRHRHLVHLRDRRIGLALLAWGLYQIALGFTEPMIDNAAHIGGLLAGGVMGWFLWPSLLSRISQRDASATE